MKRLLTAAVAVPLALLAIFKLPPLGFFLLCALLITLGAREFIVLGRAWAPGAPLASLVALVPVGAAALWWRLRAGTATPAGDELGLWLLGVPIALSVGIGTLVLLGRTPIEQVPAALAVLAYGLPYFVAPIVALALLQELDPWLVFLLCAIVWLGDTAAYYFGSWLGRHKMAPTVSPKKSWEGAAAGFLTGLLATAIWALWRRGGIDPAWLAVAAATAAAAQLGDLVESLFKRGAGVKDSGAVLPGHGGWLDRMDAMLFAAPVLLAGLWLSGLE